MLGSDISFQDVSIRALNRTLTGAQGISYKSSQASANVYGLGREPVAYTRGKREYEAEITMRGMQLVDLIREHGRGRSRSLLSVLPFDVVVSSVTESGDLVTDVLKDCRFTEVPKELALDDEFMEVTLPLAVGRIDYDTVV